MTMIITPDFERALAAVAEGKSVFLTGKAGTGKSTLLRHIRSLYKDRDLAVVAPTGVAALNVNGRTIHDFFAFRLSHTIDLLEYRPPNRLGTIDMLVIDEVSMVKAPLMDMMSRSLQRAKRSPAPYGGTQTLFIGDLYQLPPVQEHRTHDPEMESYATPFFFSSNSFRQLDVPTIELTTVFRQKDASFVAILNAVRDGTFTDQDLVTLNTRLRDENEHDDDLPEATAVTVTLASTNEYVNEYNRAKLANLPGSEDVFPAYLEGEVDKSKQGKFAELTELHLKPGAQVMLQVNQQGYANGTMATVRAISEDCITVYVPDLSGDVDVKRFTWETYETRRKGKKLVKEVVGRFTQFPLKLAWAVTVHKSQGKTFERVVYDCGSTFEAGMAYVALSRCTSLEGITLTQPVERRHIKVNPSVQRFHRRSVTARRPLLDLPVAYVGSVATGADRYRKLVEVAVVRYEGDEEVLRLSTLIRPERDASEAVRAGINATELSVAPMLQEARPAIAVALNGAVVVGFDTEEFLGQMGFPADRVEEGVGIDLANSVSSDTQFQQGALIQALSVMKEFEGIPRSESCKYRVATFQTKGWAQDSPPYCFSRDLISPLRTFDRSSLSMISEPWSQDLLLAYAVGILSRQKLTDDDADLIAAKTEVLRTKAKALSEVLRTRIQEDKIVSPAELAFLERFQTTFDCGAEVLAEGDFREKVTLGPGMRVYVSGGPGPYGSVLQGVRKQDIKERCSHAGLVFVPQFLQKAKVDVLAMADLSNVDGGSYEKARRWGIPIVSWEELVRWAEMNS